MSGAMPRAARWSRAGPPAASPRRSAKNAAAASWMPTRAPRSASAAASRSVAGSGAGTPLRCARWRTASGKSSRSWSSMNLMTSPPTPQPKQWKKPLSACTLNEGVFSVWNGQRPT